jgi:hypothetical protein
MFMFAGILQTLRKVCVQGIARVKTDTADVQKRRLVLHSGSYRAIIQSRQGHSGTTDHVTDAQGESDL